MGRLENFQDKLQVVGLVGIAASTFITGAIAFQENSQALQDYERAEQAYIQGNTQIGDVYSATAGKENSAANLMEELALGLTVTAGALVFDRRRRSLSQSE